MYPPSSTTKRRGFSDRVNWQARPRTATGSREGKDSVRVGWAPANVMPAPYRPGRAGKSARNVSRLYSLGRGSILRPGKTHAVLQHGARRRCGALCVHAIAFPALSPRNLVCMTLARVLARHRATAADVRRAATPRPARAATWRYRGCGTSRSAAAATTARTRTAARGRPCPAWTARATRRAVRGSTRGARAA